MLMRTNSTATSTGLIEDKILYRSELKQQDPNAKQFLATLMTIFTYFVTLDCLLGYVCWTQVTQSFRLIPTKVYVTNLNVFLGFLQEARVTRYGCLSSERYSKSVYSHWGAAQLSSITYRPRQSRGICNTSAEVERHAIAACLNDILHLHNSLHLMSMNQLN
jgi:hypothetical protein